MYVRAKKAASGTRPVSIRRRIHSSTLEREEEGESRGEGGDEKRGEERREIGE